MQLHWLLVKFRIEFKILLLTYKSLNALAPRYLSDLLHPYSPLRSLRSSDKDQLAIPRTRLKTFEDRTSSPPIIRCAPSVETFKKYTKAHLFSFSNSRPHPASCTFCTLTHLPTHTPSPPTLVKRS